MCTEWQQFKAPDFELIKQTEPGKGGEIQITDALMKQAQNGCVIAYKFKGQRFDCGGASAAWLSEYFGISTVMSSVPTRA